MRCTYGVNDPRPVRWTADPLQALRQAEGATGLPVEEMREATATALQTHGLGQNSMPRRAQDLAWLWYTSSVTPRRHGLLPRPRCWTLYNPAKDSAKRWRSASAPESAAIRKAALLTDSESAITPTSRPCRGTCNYRAGAICDVKGGNRRFCGQSHSILWKTSMKDGAVWQACMGSG